jgi:hypothetical protein
MGYAKGVRAGHAGGHLREPLLEALDEPRHWFDYFGSRLAARRHVGKLWHCTDILPGFARDTVLAILDLDVGLEQVEPPYTYGQLVRRLIRDLNEHEQREGPIPWRSCCMIPPDDGWPWRLVTEQRWAPTR